MGIEWLPGSGAASATARIVVATIAIGILPGAAVILLARPRRWVRLSLLLALAVGLSLAISQLGLFASLLLHIPASTIGKSILGGAVVMAIVAWQRSRHEQSGLLIDRSDALALLLLLVYAGVLFLRGAPILSDEDQTHIGIVARLAAHARPAIDNFYYAPGVIYTHPFPGISYLQALIVRLSDLDAYFVYHKLRAFFGASAVLMVYVGARQMFGSHAIALVTLLAAILFALVGRFADFGDYFWAQLATYSHPSDVAMNVAMPSALVALFAYLRSWNPRTARVYFAVALAMWIMLAVTHVRETVQIAVYTTSFAVALVWLRPRRWQPQARKAIYSIVALVVVMFAYTQFHQATVHAVASNEATHREALRKLVADSEWSAFYKGMLPGYLLGWPTVFFGWIPAALALTPAALLVYRRRPLMLLLGASLFVYLLLIRFPLFSIPFVYVTYSEILMAPARNLTYFAYLLTGVGFYWAARAIVVRGWLLKIVAVAATAGVAYLAKQTLEARLLEHIDWFYVPLLLLLAGAAVVIARRRDAVRRPAPQRVPRMAAVLASATLLLVPSAWFTFHPDAAAMSISTMRRQSDAYPVVDLPAHSPIGLLYHLSCVQHAKQAIRVNIPLPRTSVANVNSCPPTVEVVAYLRDHVGPQAVVAANILNAYPLSAFAPVQITAWPITTTYNLIYPNDIAPKFYKHLVPALQRDSQPFFNLMDTPDERRRFVDDLGVTHLVLDPMVHSVMMPVLSGDPGYELLMDHSSWAVYRVVR
jgi:hypothetical protein